MPDEVKDGLALERRLIELLAAEAPAGEFAELAYPVRGVDAADRGELSRVVLGVRATLEGLRRRERELLALYETAGDLSSLHGVEEVLHAIVRRVRQLLATDLAYITLMDEVRGVTYTRVTDGALTGEFKRLQLKLGAGLGGLVAQTGDPIITRNYMTDERIVHEPALREKVDAEGLVAVLAVPLKLGGRVIGVLYAADRQERSFSNDDAALLSSLAAHAAIALENARLFEESRAALERSDRLAAELQSHNKRIEHLAAVDDRLLDVLLTDGSLDGLVAELHRLLRAPVVLLDETGAVLARLPDGADLPVAAELGAVARGRPQRGSRHSVGGVQMTFVPMMVAGQALGAILAGDDTDGAPADAVVLERASLVGAAALLQSRAFAEAEQRVRGEIVSDLIRGGADPVALRRRTRVVGVNLDHDWSVVVAAGSDDAGLRNRARDAGLRFGGLVGESRGRLVMLMQDADPPELARRVLAALSASGSSPVSVAAAGPGRGAEAIASAYRDADRVLSAALALGYRGRAVTSHDLGLFGLLLSATDADALRDFLADTLGPLPAYDAQHATQLVHTVETYFAHTGNVTHAAKALHVHPNTLYQRLERITSLLGEDWQAPERALQLNIAVRLRHLSRL